MNPRNRMVPQPTNPGTEVLRDLLLEPDTSYQPYRGGFLLIEVEDLGTLQRRIEGKGRQLMQGPRIGGGDSGISRSKTLVATFSVSLSDSKAGKNTTVER